MNRAIEWFTRNAVAANLLMIAILVAGALGLGRLVIEFFPDFSAGTISITVPYLGAAPREVESAVVQRIEEAVEDIEGIDEIRSTAAEGAGTVLLELETDAVVTDVLDDVKARIDALETLPEETEKPIVQDIVVRNQVLTVAIAGNADEGTLKHLAERVRDDLSTLPDVSMVELAAVRPYEISIEVSELDLRRYGLTFDEVVQAVRRSSLDLPGGAIKTSGGEILLRTRGQAYLGREFESLVLRARPDGTRVLLADVATVVDGFADSDLLTRFDGERAALVTVYRTGDQSALAIQSQIKDYIAGLAPTLPAGVSATVWGDETVLLRDRLDLLVRNGRMGLILVFVVLALFVKLRLAGWVSVGIAVSFMGALALMPSLGVSINMISLFAFVMVLGIVVDDAIVVGENIYRHHEMGKEGAEAAIDGASEVAVPVTFSILTTIAAFAPMLLVGGTMGEVMGVVPLVVIACLAFSLVESLFILPTHLSHLRHKTPREDRPAGISGAWPRFQSIFSEGLKRIVDRAYRPSLERLLEWRYLVLAAALALLVFTIGLVQSGWVATTFFPPIEGDNAVATLVLPQGTEAARTSAIVARIESAAEELERQLAEEGHTGVIRHVMASIGSQPFADRSARFGGRTGGLVDLSRPHVGEVNIELVAAEHREVSAAEIARRWRELTGPVPDAQVLSFSSDLVSFGDPVSVELRARETALLEAAATELRHQLTAYPGLFDITDSLRSGKREIELGIRPEAEALGLTQIDLGRQVRAAFYGAEAQRIQRGRDDVRVMVRYPEQERNSLLNLERMRIRTPSGAEVPFSTVATATVRRGVETIDRVDRQRVVTVKADLDPSVTSSNQVNADLEATVLPELMARFPGLSYTLGGEQKEQAEALAGLGLGFLVSLLAIYGLLAIPFKSYTQPLVVMSAIPFGLIGAVWGHILLGLEVTAVSAFGLVALTGVVVNDSLVMVDFINRHRLGGASIDVAIREAGAARFRAIVMTSLTTFAGLTPLLLEKSVQARFLIPMAVSLAFGVLFATVITLVLVPLLYRVQSDLKRVFQGRRPHPQADDGAADADVAGARTAGA
ncbi:MAG TPA: efflux RND transporter permease subunit [Thermoanaerobaculia bacterium]|nr:efflux RND transporter permease subunit [Thermoanaerobaculia bacterium]